MMKNIFITSAFSLLFTLSAARAEHVDHIAAAVNNDVITGSELRQTVGLNTALSGKAANGKRLERETLEGLINRKLLLQEAYRLKFVEVSDQDVNAELEKLIMRLGPGAAADVFFRKLGMTTADVGRMLGERLLVERFVEKKISLFARVSREEAEGFFKDHAAEFKGRRFPEVQKKILSLLTEQKISQQLEQYLADLRSKAEIRVNPTEEDGGEK